MQCNASSITLQATELFTSSSKDSSSVTMSFNSVMISLLLLSCFNAPSNISLAFSRRSFSALAVDSDAAISVSLHFCNTFLASSSALGLAACSKGNSQNKFPSKSFDTIISTNSSVVCPLSLDKSCCSWSNNRYLA